MGMMDMMGVMNLCGGLPGGAAASYNRPLSLLMITI